MLHTFDTRLEAMDGFETDYLRVLYYDLPKNYKGKYKSKAYLRFCTILEGEKCISVGSKSFKYTKDQFLLLSSNSNVDMTIPDDTKALVFEISEEMIKSVAAKMYSTNDKYQKFEKDKTKVSANKIVLPSENKSRTLDLPKVKEKRIINSSFILENHNRDIKDDIDYIHNLTKRKSREEAFMVDLYAQKLVYNLLKIHPLERLLKLSSSSELKESISYINDNINKPIRVSELSDIAGMSQSSFSHAFKKIYGMSPQKYINNLKVEYSLELLKKDSVTSVAFELGFENLSHFIRLFREKYNMTPKQYQISYLR